MYSARHDHEETAAPSARMGRRSCGATQFGIVFNGIHQALIGKTELLIETFYANLLLIAQTAELRHKLLLIICDYK